MTIDLMVGKDKLLIWEDYIKENNIKVISGKEDAKITTEDFVMDNQEKGNSKKIDKIPSKKEEIEHEIEETKEFIKEIEETKENKSSQKEIKESPSLKENDNYEELVFEDDSN